MTRWETADERDETPDTTTDGPQPITIVSSPRDAPRSKPITLRNSPRFVDFVYFIGEISTSKLISPQPVE